MKRILVALLLAGGAWLIATRQAPMDAPAPPTSVSAPTDDADAVLANAFANQRSDIRIQARGVVRKILPDDHKGSRHQRFLIELSSGQSLLIAHNIDLAPRIDSLREGDTVAFNGEYEWNNKGGVIHWTHHDPQGHHPGGWLEHEGRRYE